MIRPVFTHLSALAALALTLIFASDIERLTKNYWTLSISLLTFILLLALFAWDIRAVKKSRPRAFKGKNREKKVRKYMEKLLASEDRCVVSSNDLTWVKDGAREVLFKKAGNNSLDLLMPVATELSEELVSAGAKAYYYGDEDTRFLSRFTILNAGQSGTWVAVGHGTKEAHLIREIHSSDDPTFHMAKDLEMLAKRVATKKDGR